MKLNGKPRFKDNAVITNTIQILKLYDIEDVNSL